MEHPIERDFIYRDSVAPQLASIIGDQAMDTLQTVGTMVIGMEELADQVTAYMNLLTKQARWQAELMVAETVNRRILREDWQCSLNWRIRSIAYRLSPSNPRTLIAREREPFLRTFGRNGSTCYRHRTTAP
jgi:hypothetical protein